MTTIIKQCRGEERGGIRAIDGFRNKLMISDCKILKCPEFEVKSKIGNIFKNQNPPNILLRFTKLIFIFMNIVKKKYKLMKTVVNVYYLELIFILEGCFIDFLAVEIDEKGHTDKYIIFEKKDKKNYKKNLVANIL